MITTIVNGIMVDAESIVEVHYIERRYKRYEEEKKQGPRGPHGDPNASRLNDDDTITQIMREIMSNIKRGQ